MNLTFLYNQSELDFLLFLIREQTLDLGRCRIQTCNQSARKPKSPEASFVVRKTFSHHQRTQTHKLRKNFGRHFEIEIFFITLASADSIQWLARSLTHTHKLTQPCANTSSSWETQWRRHCDVMKILVIALVCVCARAPASSVSRTTGTYVTFPSRNSWNTSKKSKDIKRGSSAMFSFCLGFSPTQSMIQVAISRCSLGCLVMSGTVFCGATRRVKVRGDRIGLCFESEKFHRCNRGY